jgi:hypothetical protein
MGWTEGQNEHRTFTGRAREESRRRAPRSDWREPEAAYGDARMLVLVHGSSCICHTCKRRHEISPLAA